MAKLPAHLSGEDPRPAMDRLLSGLSEHERASVLEELRQRFHECP
jgi:hypothetical protein